jgi:hypothetical protein
LPANQKRKVFNNFLTLQTTSINVKFCALIVSLQSSEDSMEYSSVRGGKSLELASSLSSEVLQTKSLFFVLSPKLKHSFSSLQFQVSTSTGVISHFVNLQVVVPEAFILGSGELHVDMGSAINLVCIIEKVGGPFCVISGHSSLPYPQIIVVTSI